MSMNLVFFAALYYVFVQCVLFFNLNGRWKLAAFLPIPAISLCFCLGVTTGLLGPLLSTVLMTLALPVGTAYLIVLALLWMIVERRGVPDFQRRTSAP